MRLLYLSCHEILEYDELRMFHDLGIEVYSLGAYTHPGGEEHRKRPPLPDLPYDPHFIELATRYGKTLHREQLEGVDAVILMHTPEFASDNGPLLQEYVKAGGRVIWRSIGQSTPAVEAWLASYLAHGVITDVVRYSPFERTISNFAGADAWIRFAKRPSDFIPWNGRTPVVINFTQSMRQRHDHCGYSYWRAATTGLDHILYGPGNEEEPDWGGLLSYDDQLVAISDSRALFYTGTYPASYTLSLIEAMMGGLPVIAVGERLGNGTALYPEQRTYEVPQLLPTLPDLPLVTDDMAEANALLRELIDDKELAAVVSVFVRNKALELFDEATIAPQWADFLGVP